MINGTKTSTYQRILLPEPATIQDIIRGYQVRDGTGRTFPMNPKERTCRFPFAENAALKEPGCRLLVMSTARNVMVSRRIRWGEPFVDVFPQLVF